jgi:NitT/TauT family transport system permease protein
MSDLASASRQDLMPPEDPPPTAEELPHERRWIRRVEVFAWPLGTLLLIGVVWELISRAELVDPIILPPPTDVVAAGFDLVQESYFREAALLTLQEAVIGFLLGVSVAWVLGTIIGLWRRPRLALYPFVVAIQNTPRIAFAPIFVVWFGFGISSRIVLAALTCFFPVLLSVVIGIENVDRDARTLMRSFGASRLTTYRKLELPASLPIVFGGMKAAITLALIGAVVAEFVGGNEGLGVLIKTFNFQLNVAEGFFSIFTLMVMGLLLYGLVELLDRWIVFWRGSTDVD